MTEDHRQDIVGFLRLCVRYAEDSIERKESRSLDEGGPDASIEAWKSYRDFTTHAIKEVEDGSLDTWFDHLSDEDDWRPQPADAEGGCSTPPLESRLGDSELQSTDPAALEFDERRSLMDGLITPRPFVLASTRSTSGVDNLAGITSMAVVSNHPPQVVISLSQDRDHRPRDTLVNLRQGSPITLHILPPSPSSAHLASIACLDIPADESEWELIADSPLESPSGPHGVALVPSAVAALECELLSMQRLPEGAVSTLCILAVRRVIAAESTISALCSGTPLATLCAHGTARLTSSPETGWSHDCTKVEDPR